MTNKDLWRKVQSQVKAQMQELRSQSVMERAILEARSKIQSPFTEDILAEPKLDPFQVLQMMLYDGKSDYVAFLHQFRQVMMLETNQDQLLCKMFPRVLTGAATSWFNQLRPNSISSFDEPSESLIS